MNNNLSEQNQDDTRHLSKALGCGIMLLLLFLTIWVVGFSAMSLSLRWTVEQAMFESDTGIIDMRWVTQLVYAILLFIPLIPLYFFLKAPRIKLMLRLWIIADVFVLLTIPAKVLYLTSQVQSYILFITASLLMILILFLFKKPDALKNKRNEKPALLGSAALAGLAISIPWILWGALGSILDTIVVILLGISVSLFINRSIFPFYLEKTQTSDRDIKAADFFLDGFAIAVFLLIVVTGLAQNGSESTLVLTVPMAGWLITAFSAAGSKQKDHGRLAAGVIIGLVVTLPLVFFDMDELAQIISGSAGEVMQWANQAGLYTLIFLLAVMLAGVFLFRHISKLNMSGKIDILISGVSIVIFVMVYFVFGQPGFYGDRLFVVFEKQVNPADYADIEPLSARREAIYQALTSTAIDSQTDLIEKLDRWGVEYIPYYLVNGMEVNGGLFTQMWLTRQPGVDRVLNSPHLRPLPKNLPASKGEETIPPKGTLWNLEMIHVPQVHEELGITGSGIVIGQTDSGVDSSHPELKDSYRGSDTTNDYNWLDPWYHSKSPVDYGGHGTGTLGIEVGTTRGIAPDAQWIGCVNLARNLGNPAYYLDCMQFMFAPYPQWGDAFLDGDTDQGAMIINNSWGCPRVEGCDVDIFKPAAQILKTAGIFMSAAAGNTGFYGCSSVADPPAIYGDVFTTGSVDKVGQISVFSSIGPVLVDGSNRIKPDLLAPGEQILLVAPGETYTFASGTSFAAPHVSGVVALMWSANPALIGDIDTTAQILKDSAQPFNGVDPECGDPGNGSGAGILDAYAAVKAAIALK